MCVYDNHNPCNSIINTSDVERGQAETLVPLINQSVIEAGISFQDIDCITTTKGPGTFTGLRVGLAAAKSFALALSKPLIGFTTPDVIAQNFWRQNKSNKQQLCVLLESKRSDFYCQIWDCEQNEILQATALSALDIYQNLENGPTIVIGNALDRFKEEVESNYKLEYLNGFERPDTNVLAQMAVKDFNQNTVNQDVQPLYLREADVSISNKVQRQLETEK